MKREASMDLDRRELHESAVSLCPQPPLPPRLSLIPKKIQITNCKWFSIVQTQATKIQAYLQLNYLLTNTSNFQAAFGVVEITLAT